MGHALSVYIKSNGEDKYTHLFSYGGSSFEYNALKDISVYEDKAEYKELTKEDLLGILNDIQEHYNNTLEAIDIQKECCNGNKDVIDGIIEDSKYLKSLKEEMDSIKFLLELNNKVTLEEYKLYHNYY